MLDVAPISGGLGGTERIPAFSKVTYDLHDGSRDTLISLGGDVGVSVAVRSQKPDPSHSYILIGDLGVNRDYCAATAPVQYPVPLGRDEQGGPRCSALVRSRLIR